MRVLVVYYDRASASADIAASIAEHLDADTEVIRERARDDRKRRTGLFARLAGVLRERATSLSSRRTSSDNYHDLVVIAAAGWETTTSVRMRAVLHGIGRTAKATALVYVGPRRTSVRVLRRMQQSIGRAPVAVLALDDRELMTDASMRKT